MCVRESRREMMRREETGQVKVGLGIEVLWNALTKDLNSLLPTIIPVLVTKVEILQGNGDSDTNYHFKFGTGLPNRSDQKEKVVDYDESMHRIGLQVIEGGRLHLGFTFYKNTFKLTAMGDSETLVDLQVDYETEWPELDMPPGESVKSGVAFIQALESFLLKQGS